MKFSARIKPFSYLEIHADPLAKVAPQQTLALLRILAMGKHEIENGQFRSAEEVFAQLDWDVNNAS